MGGKRTYFRDREKRKFRRRPSAGQAREEGAKLSKRKKRKARLPVTVIKGGEKVSHIATPPRERGGRAFFLCKEGGGGLSPEKKKGRGSGSARLQREERHAPIVQMSEMREGMIATHLAEVGGKGGTRRVMSLRKRN